jgi:hypothetical protein
MSMSTRQHYVPQFLLRHFAPEQHPSQVWTYDKRVGAGRLQSIRDSGHESAVIIVPLCPTLCIMLFPSRFQSDLELAGAWYRPEIGVLDEAQPTAPGGVDLATGTTSHGPLAISALASILHLQNQVMQDGLRRLVFFGRLRHEREPRFSRAPL